MVEGGKNLSRKAFASSLQECRLSSGKLLNHSIALSRKENGNKLSRAISSVSGVLLHALVNLRKFEMCRFGSSLNAPPYCDPNTILMYSGLKTHFCPGGSAGITTGEEMYFTFGLE